MKSLFLPTAILLTSLASTWTAYGQQAKANSQTGQSLPPNPKATLSDAQVNTVLDQLKDLENQVLQMRSSALSTILTRLRTGASSDQAAYNLYLECDRLVNSDRKEVPKVEARKRQEDLESKMERRAQNPAAADDGNFNQAVRLGVEYLILTLEAHETKDEDLKKMAPKLQEYIQALVSAAPKLKGRAGNYLNNALAANNPIVDAFSLSRYLSRKDWNTKPMDIGGMYNQTLLPLAEIQNPESLASLWDARINAEGIFKKENLFGPEFELWTRNELPLLRWQRATYLYQKGPSPVTGLADMLKVVKENPGHPDAPKWLESLRLLVNQSAPVPAPKSANAEAASGS